MCKQQGSMIIYDLGCVYPCAALPMATVLPGFMKLPKAAAGSSYWHQLHFQVSRLQVQSIKWSNNSDMNGYVTHK